MGDLFDFLGRHVVASIVGAVGLISYGLGVAEQAQALATRFKAWQLQALGAVFFFVAVVMVLVSYDAERREPSSVSKSPLAETLSSSPTPGVLPESISAEYFQLMAGKPTDLQVQRFLKSHAGKFIDLSLPLAALDDGGSSGLRGQFYADDQPSVFVTFSPEWGDYLQGKNVGDTIRFRAKIISERETRYALGEARPL